MAPEAPTSDGVGTTAARGRRGASGAVAAGILLSRLSGLVRESALAGFLGTGAAADAFRAAFRIPNLLQNLLGEGVLSASFIPVYSRLLEDGREEDAGRVAGAIVGFLLLVVGALALLGIVAAEPLTDVVAGGFTGARRDLTITLVRVLFPGAAFLVLSAWCLGVLNSHRRFFLSYVAPVVWNGAQVAVLVALGLTVYAGASSDPSGPEAAGLAVALAWGAVAGGALQLAVQLPGVLRAEPHLRWSLRRTTPVRQVLRAFVPVVGARGVVQLSAYLDVLLASFLVIGAPAVLGFAQILYLLPVSLFGMSVAAAELPELSRLGVDRRDDVARRVEQGLGRIATFVVPTAAVYLLAGDLVVGALFQRGAFGRTQTIQTWLVLGGYAVGLFATTASRLLQSALYATGRPRVPARASTVRVLVSTALGIVLMLQLDRVGVVAGGLELAGDVPATAPLPPAVRSATDAVPRLGAAGLSLAAGGAAWVELVLLRRAARATVGPVRLLGGRARAVAAVTAAAIATIAVLRPLVAGLPAFAEAGVTLVPAAAAAVAVGVVVGVPETAALRRAVGRLRRDRDVR